jgi:hypothetical protein
MSQQIQFTGSDLPDIAGKLNGIVNSVIGNKEIQLFEKAFLTASAIQQLSAALTPEYMKPIMFLQGSKLGFKTDKDDKGGYPESVVKNCIIDAVLQGFQVVGNQFNIIAGNFYGTKEGYGYLLSQMSGLWYEITPNLPRVKDTAAAIVMSIRWKYNGYEGSKDLDVPVKVNAYMGTDAIIGKATRKARHWLYCSLTGSEMPEGDVTDVDFKTVSSKPLKEEVNHEIERATKLIEAQTTIEKLDSILTQFSDELKIELHPVIENHRIFIASANG